MSMEEVELKKVYEWKSNEPWKKHEPGARLSQKDRALQEKSKHERLVMEKRSTQHVKVIFKDYLFGLPDLIHSFQVDLKIPLSTKEIMKRMGAAFPELELKQMERKS